MALQVCATFRDHPRPQELDVPYLRCSSLSMGLQVFPQADECDEQGGRLKEAHVVNVDALLVQGAAVHSREDGVDVSCVGSQRHQDIHVGRSSPQRPQRTRMEVPPDDELHCTGHKGLRWNQPLNIPDNADSQKLIVIVSVTDGQLVQ